MVISRTKILGINTYCRQLNPTHKKGAPILWVHAHPLSGDMWQYQLQALHQFRLIIPDMIGYGKTLLPTPPPKTIYLPQQALYLRLLLDSLSVSKVHLVGLSMGGEIITEFARLFPQATLSLTLCANIPRGESVSSAQKRLKSVTELKKIGMKGFAQKNIPRFIDTTKYPPKSGLYRQIEKMMASTPLEGASAYTRGRAERRDNLPFLKTFKKPVLVIAGEKDTFFSLGEMKQMAKKIPHAEFRVISQSGHLVNMEAPEQFNQLLLDFYRKIATDN